MYSCPYNNHLIDSKESFLNLTRSDRFLIFLPFYHGYAFGLLMMSLINCASAVITSGFEPVRFMKMIEEYKPTILPVVPPVMTLLAKHPMVEKYDFRSVRQIICGAAPLAEEVSFLRSRSSSSPRCRSPSLTPLPPRQVITARKAIGS